MSSAKAAESLHRRPISDLERASVETTRRSLRILPRPGSDEIARSRSERARLQPGTIRSRLIAADLVAMMAGFGAALVIAAYRADSGIGHELLLVAVAAPGFAVGAVLAKLYRARANTLVSQELGNVVKATAFGSGFMAAAAFGLGLTDVSAGWVLTVAAAVGTFVAIERLVARHVFADLRSTGRLSRRIVIVGTTPHSQTLLGLFRHDARLGYDAIGLVGPAPSAGAVRTRDYLGTFDDVESILEQYGASGVVLDPSGIPPQRLNNLTRRLTDAGYHVAISASLFDIDAARLRPQNVGGYSMLYVEPVARQGAPMVAKRVFDIVTATLLIILTAPIALVAAIAIKVTSPGPVLFRQTRVGKDGVPFTMSKLRTMVNDAEDRQSELLHANEADGPLFKIADDPRVTRVGRFLRSLSIDELPQLFSVLRGTMSMVGPRPALPKEAESWDAETTERLRVRPGLTGLWQVSGRSDADFQLYKRLDLFYVDNWSIRHDVAICFRTVGAVLSRRGAR